MYKHSSGCRYSVSDEEEKKRNAELLLAKTKEQLARKEAQYTQEMEQRQQAELTMRNVQMELRAAHNTVKEVRVEGSLQYCTAMALVLKCLCTAEIHCYFLVLAIPCCFFSLFQIM